MCAYTPDLEDLDVPDATPGGGYGYGYGYGCGCGCPDLIAFCRLDELGLEVTGQRVQADRAVLACRITKDDSCVGAAVSRAVQETA